MLADVGMQDMPFPMRVASRENPDGQHTVGNISIHARILHEFESRWIDTFIRIIHQHRNKIATKNIRTNIIDYMRDLNATMVRIDYDYPFFVEKLTPVTKEKCLVRYRCVYSSKIRRDEEPKTIFKIEIPAITTDPASVPEETGGLFGQLSMLSIEIEPLIEVYPEDLIDMVDLAALAPAYSFLSPQDQIHLIKKIHEQKKSSVVLTNDVKDALAKNGNIEWYSVRCTNHSLLHSYNTAVATEKSMWIPYSCYDFEQL